MDNNVYPVRIAPDAERQLKKLPKNDKRRIAEKIKALARDPRPRGVKKIRGLENLYRIRDGDFRVVYQLKDKIPLVLVVRIARRKEAYRNL